MQRTLKKELSDRLLGPIASPGRIALEGAPAADFLQSLSALDLGTGCGVVSLILRGLCGVPRVTASDVSVNAVHGAREELKRQGMEDVEVIHSDLFEGLGGRKYDLVVFNPPWLPFPSPTPGEPARTQLDSGNFYPEDLFVRLFDGLPKVLNPGGTALLLFSNHALARGYVNEHPFKAAMSCSKSDLRVRELFTRDFNSDGRRRRTGRPHPAIDDEPMAELWEFRLGPEVAEGKGVQALAATGASAAAGIAVLAATGAAVVTGTARSSDAEEPCWASHCGRQDQLSSELVSVLPAGVLEVPGGHSDSPCSPRNTVHEITPYSEVYGMHPQLLGIQRGSSTLEPLEAVDWDEASNAPGTGSVVAPYVSDADTRKKLNENKFLVRRILSVKSSVDFSGLEKDYWRRLAPSAPSRTTQLATTHSWVSWHRKVVSRLQQIPLPKLQSEADPKPGHRSRRKVTVEAELMPSRTPSAGSFRPVRSQLPLPMPKSSSAPVLAPLHVEERPAEKPRKKKRPIAKELPTSEAAHPHAKAKTVPAPSLHRMSGDSQEKATAEFIAEEVTTEACEELQSEARSMMNDTLGTWPSQASRNEDGHLGASSHKHRMALGF
eukprot:Skav220712  [mRNA]  locus=scaffold1850:26260:39998:- [translate_table: standard]